jgi:hypothetical protein
MQEQTILPLEIAPLLHDAEAGPQRPLPSVQQEQLTDEVFSQDQGELTAAVLALQAGLNLAGHLAIDALQSHQERQSEEQRRRNRRPCVPQE